MAVQHDGDESTKTMFTAANSKIRIPPASVTVYTIYSRHRGKVMIYQPDENRYHTMEYRRCGRSGVKLPLFRWGYGTTSAMRHG